LLEGIRDRESFQRFESYVLRDTTAANPAQMIRSQPGEVNAIIGFDGFWLGISGVQD